MFIGGKNRFFAVPDAVKFLAALRRVSITDAPRGPVSFDDYGHPIENIYVRRVERVDGRLQNTVIHTFTGVSQFGPYRPEEFLKNPVYSRDWPPCKACLGATNRWAPARVRSCPRAPAAPRARR